MAPPFKQAEFDIIYGKGISMEGCVLDMGVEAGIVNKAGAWYSYEGNRLGQGRDNSKEYIKANPELMEEIETKIKEKYALDEVSAKEDSTKNKEESEDK